MTSGTAPDAPGPAARPTGGPLPPADPPAGPPAGPPADVAADVAADLAADVPPDPSPADPPAAALPPAAGWGAPAEPRLPDRPLSAREQSLTGAPDEDATPEPVVVVAHAPVAHPAAVVQHEQPEGEDAQPPRRPAPRRPMVVQGVGPALLAAVLLAGATLGTIPFAVAVLLSQVFLVLALLALLESPAARGASALAVGAAVAADVAIVFWDGDVRALAGIVALTLVASLLHQLLRRRRQRVTEVIANTLLAVVLATSAACLLALQALADGEAAVSVALVAAGVSLLLARIGDRLLARPVLAVGATRGWPGLLVGLATGAGAGLLVASTSDALGGTQAALLGLVSAATVAAGDLALDLAASELRAGRRDRRRVEALTPTSVLLPFALLGPIALVAGHLVLG